MSNAICEITMNTCTFKDWEAIVRKAISQAKKGDVQARKWLSDYLVGSPDQNVNLRTDIINVMLQGDD